MDIAGYGKTACLACAFIKTCSLLINAPAVKGRKIIRIYVMNSCGEPLILLLAQETILREANSV
jgi:hypothetical protein